MNSIPNTSFQLPVDFESTKALALDLLPPREPGRRHACEGQPSCTLQRQARTASVIDVPVEPALEAANEAPVGVDDASGAAAGVVHFGRDCLVRRFQSWLHGSEVLDAPPPVRYLDSPQHQAEALALHRRAVRADSYVPAGTPRLLI